MAQQKTAEPRKMTDPQRNRESSDANSPAAKGEQTKPASNENRGRTSDNPSQPAPSIRGNPEAGKPQEQRKRGRH